MYRKEVASAGLILSGGGQAEKISAQIISEAKASISKQPAKRLVLEDIYKKGRPPCSGSATKLVVTERPFTPKPRERHLYPRGTLAGRPHSGVSINLQLIEEEGASSR